MNVSLTFLGAAEGVTGSRHLLEVDGTRILVDCGLFQGRRKQARERNEKLPLCDPGTLHNVILTHGHIDHSGALPILVREGFKGQIFCTNATADLARILLRDSGSIQESDARHLNKQIKKAARRSGKPVNERRLVEPLYTRGDAEAVDSCFHGLPYDHTERIGPGITVRFTDQGHIIGSAAALVTIERGDRAMRIVFSGDRGRFGHPILRDPQRYPWCDVLLTESTYGDRTHPEMGQVLETLYAQIRHIKKTKGKLIIPAFAVGRTQNVLYYLHEGYRKNLIPKVPVFVDSPLATRATEVYANHPECFDAETLDFLRHHANPFEFNGLRYVADTEESKALNEHPGPYVVVSASGMCESGRVLHHLKHGVTDPRNVVMLVGYMARHTLGRRLLEGAEEIRIFDGKYPVRARVVKVNGLSAHADQRDLVASTRHLVGVTNRIYLVHGERDALVALRTSLRTAGHRDVRIARLGRRVVLSDD